MKLTTKSEYALLALLHMARQDPSAWTSVDAVARAKNIPPKFLEQILLALKRARLLRSTKGKHGGYQLAKPAGQISIAEIVRVLDGALAPVESVSEYFYESTPIEGEPGLVRVFKKIRDYASDLLESTTLADICRNRPLKRRRTK
ncbi:MAG TPA: Rrf2 family transcriptional regulator [Kiritimatiellia bacterium]|nr:Rrf2 family transcriptional regulator [Kiritimatiellia bacterium]